MKPQTDIQALGVQEHNKHRKKHGVADLKGDESIRKDAQQHVTFLAETGRFEPATYGKYGCNIAVSLQQKEEDAIRDVVGRWYDKVRCIFDYELHATNLGIGLAWSDWEKSWIVCAFYSPLGP